METIDLKDYRKSGEGANGASYDSLADSSVMVKMYNPDYPTDPVFSELEVARKVYELGIPSPEPGVIVTDGRRIGIRFRRIEGKRSYSRMLADEPGRVEEYAREFARYCKGLHATECPESLFPDAREQFLSLLEADRTFNPAEKEVIASFIRSVPASSTALHGDMHIGNLISTLPEGAPLDSPHDVYFIDLGYFGRGYPLFDLGMLRTICLDCDEEFRQHDFHIGGELAREVWNFFLDEYFFAEDKLAEKFFGPGQTLATVDAAILPYQCCKLLLVEFNLGFMIPHYEDIIRRTFKLVRPKISVVTVTYNAADTLERTVRSVADQDYGNIEHIIVDGASTDGTMSIVEKCRYNFANVISEPDRGIYDAMNKGLAAVSGDYVIFLNAGDTFHDATTVSRAVAGAHGLPDVIYGQTAVVDNDGHFLRMRHHSAPETLEWRSFKDGMLVCHQAFWASAALAKDTAFDLSYRFSSDVDWCIRVMKRAGSFHNTGSILVDFLDGGVSKKNHFKSLVERFKVMRIHYGLPTTVFSHIRMLFRSR